MKRTSLNLLSNVFKILSDLYDLNIKVKLLKEIDKHTDYITFSELQEILNKTDKEAAAMAAFLFCTGLRPVSVLSIKKEQLMSQCQTSLHQGSIPEREEDIRILSSCMQR